MDGGRWDLEKVERRDKRILLMVSGVIAAALAPVVFVRVVVDTMEPSDCIPGWGPCPTIEGVAAGAAVAGVLIVIACVLFVFALKNWDRRDPVNAADDKSRTRSAS